MIRAEKCRKENHTNITIIFQERIALIFRIYAVCGIGVNQELTSKDKKKSNF